MSVRSVLLAVVVFGGTACPPPAVDEAACAEFCAEQRPAPSIGGDPAAVTPAATPAATTGLTAFEQEILGDALEDLRAGVRPLDDKSLGICPLGANKRECPEMLGASPGELPPGEYILYGAFQVPRSGERGDWSVKVEIDCTTTRASESGSSETTSNWSKEYEVAYAGQDKEGNARPYVLSPMRRIKSPNAAGAQSCTWKTISPHGDGDKVFEGSWSVPAE